MVLLGNVLILIALAMILLLSIFAIIRGYRGIKISKRFETTSKKIKISYLVLSVVQMSAGIIVTLSYLISGLLILIRQGCVKVGLLFLLPTVVAILGFIIAMLGFIGICLLIIGGTGIVMSKIYNKQEQSKTNILQSIHNVSSLILGAILILFPVGYVLYGIISTVLK